MSSKQGALSAPVGFSGREQLAGAAISGAAWKGTSQVVSQVARFALAIVLAHLLTPSDYGIAGMVLVFSVEAAERARHVLPELLPVGYIREGNGVVLLFDQREQ